MSCASNQAGTLSGRAVLVHGGSPSCRHLADSWLADARDRGIHLISYDRPGYGRSTAQPGRTIADCVSDVRTIAGALDIERLGVWGYSGGGPHALACAALLPDLVTSVATLASVAPYGAPGTRLLRRDGRGQRRGLQAVPCRPGGRADQGSKEREELLQVTPEGLIEAWATLLSPTDAAVLTGEMASFLVSVLKEALAPGDQGWWDDGVAELADWGFDSRRDRACRFSSGTGPRTGSSRSSTASGWRTTSPVSRHT